MHCIRIFIVWLFVGLVACVPVSDVPDDKKQAAEVNYKMAISQIQANNPTMALKRLLLAVEQDPQNSDIHVALAQAYQMKRSYLNAERHYLKALELSDNNPRYLNNLASLYLDMQQWDKAIEYFDKASADLLFFSPHIALSGKGYALFRKKDYQAALEQYDEVIAIAPRYATAYYLKSEVYREMGEVAESRRALERAISIAPEYAQANYQLGILLLKEKEDEQAIKKFRMVVEVAPDSEVGMKSAEMLQGLEGQ